MASSINLFLDACWGRPVARPPIWIMRQAGRYLPEYRAVRERVEFLTLCRTPELAAEVTLQPVARFGFDAAIVFSDIMMPLEAMGVELAFAPGPIIARPIRSAADVAALRQPEPDEIAPYVAQAIKILRRALQVPVIGFAGAPLTLAAYLVEGRGSKDFSQMRAFLYAQPAAAHTLLDRLATAMLHYLRAQVQAGAQAVQVFDSWAGVLSRADYERFALPPVQKLMRGLRGLGVPRIYFANNAGVLWPALAHVDAEVLGVDWRQDLAAVRNAVGPSISLQGNLDPAALFAPPDEVARMGRALLHAGGGQRHIVNLGHGILPHTPLEGVEALLDVVRAYDPRESEP